MNEIVAPKTCRHATDPKIARLLVATMCMPVMLPFGLSQLSWAGIAATVAVVVLLILLLAILAYFAFIALAIARAAPRKPQPPRRTQTAFGEFVQEASYWKGAVDVADRPISITAADVDGQPNPALLSILPTILADIHSLERTAREHVDVLTSRHELDGITDGESVDFALSFAFDNEHWGESVFVEFKDATVVSWNSAD
jgi:hypothetical protein